MSIYFDRLLSISVFNYVNTKIFQGMSPLQKKIALIGLACLSYLALFYLVRCLASCSMIERRKIGKIRENKRERQRSEPANLIEEQILDGKEIEEKYE